MLPVIILLLLTSGLISAALAAHAWHHRSHPATPFFAATMTLAAFWSFGFLLEIVSPTLTAKLFWANVQFFGIAPLPVVWLAMTIHYAGFQQRLGWIIPVTGVVPVITLCMIWTDHHHHLFRASPVLESGGHSFPLLANHYGPWFYWGHAVFSYAMFAASFILLLLAYRRAVDTYRRQIAVLLASTALPLTVDLLYVLGVTPIAGINLATFGFSLSGLLITWSLFSYRFLDVMPVARGLLVDTMDDAWIVLDAADRLLDFNQAAEQIWGHPLKKAVGQPFARIPGGAPPVVRREDPRQARTEIEVSRQGRPAHYELRQSPLVDPRGRCGGRLVVLRDVTRRKQVEAERERLLAELQRALATVRKLEGLLPICAGCKKIRDEQGTWRHVEEYIRDHSQVEFSHGICPQCAERFYPEYQR